MKVWAKLLVIEVARKRWEQKTPSLDEFVCFQIEIWKYFTILVRNYLFLKIYVTSEGAVPDNVLYYQKLSNARYQVSF